MSVILNDMKNADKETKTNREADAQHIDPILKDIINKSLESTHPILQKALKQEQAFRAKTEEELNGLFFILKKIMSEKDVKQIKEATLAKLGTDLDLITSLNKALESFKPKDIMQKDYKKGEDEQTCTYPSKFNKMALALPGAETLIKQHFEDIFCKGIFPKGYTYHSKANDITILGENAHSIYGNSKGTFLKTAALTVHLACTGMDRLQYLNLNAVKVSDHNKVSEHNKVSDNTKLPEKSWIHDSSVSHVTYLPQKLNLSNLIKMDSRFEKFSYYFSDDLIPQGLAFVHSGYAFGGQRDTSACYNMVGKLYGPEDCSSWIAKLCGSPIQFSTFDQLYSYRLQIHKQLKTSLEQASIGQVPFEYESSQTASVLQNLFEPVLVKDPQKDIRPGQIYAHRSYDLTQDPTLLGPGTKGGHTGLVLDFISNGKESNIVVLAYGRDMPKEEGFGIQQFPFAPEHRRVMLFSVKAPHESNILAYNNAQTKETTNKDKIKI